MHSSRTRRPGVALAVVAATLAALFGITLGAAPASAAPSVTFTSSNLSPAPGDQFTLTITGTSDGNYTDANFRISNTNSPDFADVTSLVACSGAASCEEHFEAQRVNLGNLTTGQPINLTMTLQVDADAPSSNAFLYYTFNAGGQTRGSGNGPAFNITAPAADLAVDLSASPNGILTSTVKYELDVANGGPGALSAATITTTFSGAVTNVTSPDGCTSAGGTVSCPIGALASGASTTAEFSVQPGLLALGPFTATSVRTTSTPNDPNPANDTATASCTALTSLIVIC
ncbi:hypothetical protein CLV28_0578 [Sediminihabitans luteus]|uniref:DUF11 domain-containing protein n=1 Tax=Sediminihabitans luteus TaxID=1138585 RepID=A0A2M9CZL9_9CELL|nr:DUF11 domain-containing protein [Sediminihabitans luteus]PJJ77359.1 hypothetical protein CLV28_0578 [Sediminihabitans luteus]GII98810.1 hypothetical protein Slu03_11880 [Sediminihabitans luteus]